MLLYCLDCSFALASEFQIMFSSAAILLAMLIVNSLYSYAVTYMEATIIGNQNLYRSVIDTQRILWWCNEYRRSGKFRR